MKIWVDVLCINQADVVDCNTYVLHIKDIFSSAFAVTIWTKEHEDLEVLGLDPPDERLLLCKTIIRQYGRLALEELLRVRHCD